VSRGRVAIAPHVEHTLVEGTTVLMDLKQGSYLGLDPVATRIWRSLAEHGDPQRAAAELCQDYEVESARALADVERWVAELAARGLVVVAPG
jgi:hypothetical protein